MRLLNASVQLPQKANAGLNFYASVTVAAGATQLSILEVVFPEQKFAPNLAIAATIVSLFVAPAITQFAFPARADSFILGFLSRALLTIGLAVVACFSLFQPSSAPTLFWLYLVLYLLLGLAHKIYFNVGWLHVMAAVTPKKTANSYVARVRRVNGVSTAVLSVGTLLALQFQSNIVFLIYVWSCAIAYAFWSFWVLRRAIRTDVALNTTLQNSFEREATRYPLVKLLDEFRNKQTWRWLWPAILPTFLVPPVLFLFAVKILQLDWQGVLFTLLAAQLLANLFLPRFIELFRAMTSERLRWLLFLLAGFNLLLLISNKLANLPDIAALGLVGVNSVIGALIGQVLSIVVHNEVIRLGISKSDSPRTFVVYNFALDAFPGIWMLIGSLLILSHSSESLLTPYEMLCISGLIIFAISLFLGTLFTPRESKNV